MRDKVAQLEQQLLLTGGNNSSYQDKENSAPAMRSKLMKRLVGRACRGPGQGFGLLGLEPTPRGS